VDLDGSPIGCAIGTAAALGDHGITSASQLVECAEHARFVAERRKGPKLTAWSDLKASGEASITLHPILVVDDDPQICVLIKRILNRNMYEVTGAESVAEAMSMLERGNRYEVLLTDLALPHQDGMEMIRLGKSVDSDMIPVVISGNISKEADGKLREQGAHEIIKKPFEPTHLRQVVQNAVELYTRTQRKTERDSPDAYHI
jgi:CheY-like chemotaxis protein